MILHTLRTLFPHFFTPKGDQCHLLQKTTESHVLFSTNERHPSPNAPTNQRALSPLSAGDDSGGGFPAGEEPARASLQGEGPAVLRGTQVIK